ncbi:hypothetical protein B0T16DRAFT_450801 [Cercophora newfieldiana]|uniref:Uncharacterized protein n=1 Tax=Cercophora newfieldiana TaxID=92897 RepID=A0AA39YNW3_9PEZI|nr:hypothetical protein B0T16DRAFT_450801 [Cercophora newfieldiana]
MPWPKSKSKSKSKSGSGSKSESKSKPESNPESKPKRDPNALEAEHFPVVFREENPPVKWTRLPKTAKRGEEWELAPLLRVDMGKIETGWPTMLFNYDTTTELTMFEANGPYGALTVLDSKPPEGHNVDKTYRPKSRLCTTDDAFDMEFNNIVVRDPRCAYALLRITVKAVANGDPFRTWTISSNYVEMVKA